RAHGRRVGQPPDRGAAARGVPDGAQPRASGAAEAGVPVPPGGGRQGGVRPRPGGGGVTVDIGRLVQGVTRMVAGLRQPEWRNRALALVASLGLLLLVPADLTRTAATFVPLRQPFRGAELFVDPDTAAARWQAAHGAGWLDPITRHPQARWVNGPTDIPPAAAAARRAHQQGRLAVLVAYHIPDRDCAGPGAGAASAGDYDRFIGQLIAALGPHPVAIVVEPDAVAADCFTSDRARLLSRTVLRLAHAGHHVYLDAGHPNWRPVGEMVGRLLAAGIAG